MYLCFLIVFSNVLFSSENSEIIYDGKRRTSKIEISEDFKKLKKSSEDLHKKSSKRLIIIKNIERSNTSLLKKVISYLNKKIHKKDINNVKKSSDLEKSVKQLDLLIKEISKNLKYINNKEGMKALNKFNEIYDEKNEIEKKYK